MSVLDLEAIKKRAEAATKGPWRSMRDGNQYIGTKYMPTAKCVGASWVEGVVRPWNPHRLLAFGFPPEEYERARFLDADADFIAHARADVPALVAEVERLRAQLVNPELYAVALAVHGALGWGFDPNTVSPVMLSRAAAELAKAHMALCTEAGALRAELAQAKADHVNACALVAKMHAAAVGEVCGPDVGPVEDVAAVRAKWLKAKDELERERMRLAACGVVALANTRELAAKARDFPAEYQSASCDDVARAVDRGMALREERDAVYAERAKLLVLLARLALKQGWKVGVAQHPAQDAAWDADWRTILFVDLPTGQASWHFHDDDAKLLAEFPPYVGTWDGHTTPQKYERVLEALASPDQAIEHERGGE